VLAQLAPLRAPAMAHVPTLQLRGVDNAFVPALAFDMQVEALAREVANVIEWEVRAHGSGPGSAQRVRGDSDIGKAKHSHLISDAEIRQFGRVGQNLESIERVRN